MSLLSQASLVVVPSGYKEDVVYSVKPTDGSGDLTFTRASDGTRVNSSGLVENVPWNLLSNSEQFTSANGWFANVTGSSTASQTSDYGVAPNGTTTADRIQLALNGELYADWVSIPTTGIVVGQVYTYSIYLKSLSGTPTIYFFNDNTTNIPKTLTTDWVRYDYTWIATSATIYPRFLLQSGSSTSADLLAWGYQLNIGSTAKPYFPTTDRQNVPRLTYEGGCPSLLLEPQRTNLALYSDQLDNAVHNQLGLSITANNITSPDGTQNADKIIETTANSEHILYDIDSNASGTYTLSAFFKGGAGTIFPVLRLNGADTTAYAGCIFNTSTGAVVNTFYDTYSAPTTKVENMGNGWYRVSMTTTTTNTNFGMRIAASNSASPSVGSYGSITYTGSTSNYFYAWGAQLEAGSYATSYIPTTSAAVTRVADAAYKTGISSLIGQTEGTLFAEFQGIDTTALTSLIPTISDGTINNSIKVYYDPTANGIRAFIRTGGSLQTNTVASVTPNAGINKIAVGYKLNDLAIYFNGSLIISDASISIPATNNINLFDNETGTITEKIQGNQAVLFKTRLTNAELAALTTL